jgi:hypothetical protein
MEKNNETPNKIVQTYAEDMAGIIENDKSGLVKKIIHGEEEHEKEKRNFSPESAKNKFFILVGFICIVLGFTILFYFMLAKDVPTVPIEQQFTPLIFNDTSTTIEVAGFNKDKIALTVHNAVEGAKVKAGGVEGIYLINNKKSIGLRQFIGLIKSSFVPDNNPLFVSNNFMLGAVNGETKDFFMLIKVRSITDIFDSMQAWEEKMFFDLSGFFGMEVSAENKYLLAVPFQNGIIENKNARILYDSAGNIVIMYIYADDNSVVITNTESSAHEIMLRLAASRVKK